MEQFVQKSELRVVLYVVGQRRDGLAKLFKFLHRPARDPCRGFLVHGMDHDAIVVEGQDAIGLVAVGEKASGDCMADHQRDQRMAGESRRTVCVGCRRCGKKDAGGLFAAAVGLALQIDNRDDGPLGGVLVELHHFTHTRGQGVGLFESNLPLPGTRKACVWIWNNTQESRVVSTKRCIRGQYGFRVTRHWGSLASECAEPYGSPDASKLTHRLSSFEPFVPQARRSSLGSHWRDVSSSAMRLR